MGIFSLDGRRGRFGADRSQDQPPGLGKVQQQLYRLAIHGRLGDDDVSVLAAGSAQGRSLAWGIAANLDLVDQSQDRSMQELGRIVDAQDMNVIAIEQLRGNAPKRLGDQLFRVIRDDKNEDSPALRWLLDHPNENDPDRALELGVVPSGPTGIAGPAQKHHTDGGEDSGGEL